MTTKSSVQDEKALLHLTLETVNLSLRKVFRELNDCGPSCRKNVLKHLTELSVQLDGIEKKLSVGEWAKLNLGSMHQHHNHRNHKQHTKSLKWKPRRSRQLSKARQKRPSSKERRRRR